MLQISVGLLALWLRMVGAMDHLERARLLFGDIARPDHFTDYRHCCECAEHDELLQSRDPQSIRCEDLGPAWDPMCFVTDDGFRYFFPGLVRLALEGTGETYFVGQLLFHLTSDGPRNRRWSSFSPTQRLYVAQLLEHLVETRAEEIDRNRDTDNILRAIEIWAEGS
jgi:hypothetical protein